MKQAALRFQTPPQASAGVRCENMKRRGLDTLSDGPIYGSLEYGLVVLVHAEDETGVDHDTEIMQAFDGLIVASVEVRVLVLGSQAVLVERLESNEQAAQSGSCRFFHEVRLQNGLHRPARLPNPAHSFHCLE